MSLGPLADAAAAQGRPGLFDGVGTPPPAAVAADERAYAKAAAAILADPAKRYNPAYNPFAASPDCFGLNITSLQCDSQVEALANDPRKSLSCRLGLLCANPPAIPGYTPYQNIRTARGRTYGHRSHARAGTGTSAN